MEFHDYLPHHKLDDFKINYCFECNESPCQLLEVEKEFIYLADIWPTKSNKQIRYALRRKYVRQFFGVLGRGVRKKLPNCFERFLKRHWPSAQYIGFWP